MKPNPAVWMGSSYDDLCALPDAVQRQLGRALYLAQIGEISENTKQMRGVLRDVFEVVAADVGGTFRMMYTVKLGDFVYVLHAFQKKSKRGVATPKRDIDLIRHRLSEARMKHENRNLQR
jgi:phage-related protein